MPILSLVLNKKNYLVIDKNLAPELRNISLYKLPQRKEIVEPLYTYKGMLGITFWTNGFDILVCTHPDGYTGELIACNHLQGRVFFQRIKKQRLYRGSLIFTNISILY